MKGNEEGVDAGERQLGSVEEGEAVVTMYCISKESIFNKIIEICLLIWFTYQI